MFNNPAPEPADKAPTNDRFHQLQEATEQHTWQGNACLEPLPGGGNDLKEHK